MRSNQEKTSSLRPEGGPTCFKDGRIAGLFEKHADLIEGDRVFQKIFEAINNGWEDLENPKKQVILDLIEELIEALKGYSRAYTLHKGAARRKTVEDFQTIKDYQAGVKRADSIERALHNRFIDSVNILSRRMKAVGLDNSWRADEKIYGLTEEATRQKLRNWMLGVFKEKN